MIPRTAFTTVARLARGFPIVAITGPRQSGKTTLARAAFPGKPYVSLENSEHLDYATTDPRRFLAGFPDGAIIDEAQRCPDLFSYLQGWVDDRRRMGDFVLTGSQQFGLMSRITQSLAGRVGLVQLLPFSLSELAGAGLTSASVDEALWRGAYPALYDRDLSPGDWFPNYVATYVERDVRQLLAGAPIGVVPALPEDVRGTRRPVAQPVVAGGGLRYQPRHREGMAHGSRGELYRAPAAAVSPQFR